MTMSTFLFDAISFFLQFIPNSHEFLEGGQFLVVYSIIFLLVFSVFRIRKFFYDEIKIEDPCLKSIIYVAIMLLVSDVISFILTMTMPIAMIFMSLFSLLNTMLSPQMFLAIGYLFIMIPIGVSVKDFIGILKGRRPFESLSDSA